jgi:hypothetical protein
MRISVAALLIAAIIGVRPTAAQDGVTSGITYGPDGNMINLGACGNSPAVPQIHYGAVAISPSTLNVGGSHGEGSRNDAIQKALPNCRRGGAKDCTVPQSAGDGCAAVATTANPPGVPGAWGADIGRDRATAAAAAAALSQCQLHGKGCVVRVALCGGDDVRWSSPLPLPVGDHPGSVDSRLVGTWALLRNPGYWLWKIGPAGTYTFYSEAPDGAPTNTGTFAAKDGHYTMHLLSMTADDVGTYQYQAPGTLVAAGKLGTGNWQRVTRDPFR